MFIHNKKILILSFFRILYLATLNKRRKVFNVQSLTLRGSILQMALNREDEFGKIVWKIFSTIYAPITADKMLTGHAYSRAVRGHTLVHLALSNIFLQ